MTKEEQAKKRRIASVEKKARKMAGSKADTIIPCWHTYHNLIAARTIPLGRIFDILYSKPPSERKLRLKLFRLIKDEKTKEWVHEMYKHRYPAERLSSPPDFVLEAHKRECVKDCPWNGKTIFSD